MMKTALLGISLLAMVLCMCGENSNDDNENGDTDTKKGDAGTDVGEDTETASDTLDTEDAVASCAASVDDLEDVSLAEAFADHFDIGVALNNTVYDGIDADAVDLVTRNFNRISPENALKWVNVQPQQGMFRFSDVDDYVEFGEAHGMTVYGHVLLWHSQVPSWLFTADDGSQVGREELLERLEAHIAAFADRYGGRIQYWDVVNEAFDSDGSLKDTLWKEIIGDDYIEQAFRIADRLLPDSKLVYNDYSMYLPGRRDAVIALVETLRDAGVRIDAVGMQAHYNFKYPSLNDLEAALAAYRDADIEVLITELDLDVLPSYWDIQSADISDTEEADDALNPYAECLPEDIDALAAERWGDLFKLFVEYSDTVSSVTIWGVSDDQSWLNDWPIEGRTNYGVLFDRNLEPKSAVRSILAALD